MFTNSTVKRKGFLFIWGALAVATISLALSQTQAGTKKLKLSQMAPQFVPGEVIIKLKQAKLGTYAMATTALLNNLGKRYALTISPFETDQRFAKLKFQSDAPMGQILADVQANPQVAYAEPNFIYHAFDMDPLDVIPNDPRFAQTWGMLNTGQNDPKGVAGKAGADIGATKAWELGKGSRDIVVAVIDTGVDYTHEDLKENIFENTKEIAGNGKDDDGNGFVDDVHGWNFQGNTNDPMDDHRHGTHCSGTIGAKGGNAIGVAGVTWNVRIMPIKFLSASGSGSLEDAVKAIQYATKMGANIMSNSWGGGGFSQTMFDAIKAAKDKGILFVAAAGNDSNDNDASPSYPATYDSDSVISVAAMDNKDTKASFSNYGAKKVHLGAPGVNIMSTVPASKGGYDSFSGTSMACPHVAGAAALLWSMNPKMTYADIKARLLATVDPVRAMKKKVLTGGRLNINNAVRNIVPDRGEPPADRWKGVAKAVESKHPYDNSSTQTFEVSHPGAKFMRLHFSKVGTEPGYDFVVIKSASGEVLEEITGEQSNYTTDYIEGNKLQIIMKSDSSVDGFGFAMDKYEFID